MSNRFDVEQVVDLLRQNGFLKRYMGQCTIEVREVLVPIDSVKDLYGDGGNSILTGKILQAVIESWKQQACNDPPDISDEAVYVCNQINHRVTY